MVDDMDDGGVNIVSLLTRLSVFEVCVEAYQRQLTLWMILKF